MIYLPSDAQDKLFDDITALSAPGSRLATERVHDVAAFVNGRPREISEKMRELGSTIDMEQLVFQEQRTNVVDHLGRLGWAVTELNSREAHAVNGFEFPEHELTAAFGDLSYVSAVLN